MSDLSDTEPSTQEGTHSGSADLRFSLERGASDGGSSDSTEASVHVSSDSEGVVVDATDSDADTQGTDATADLLQGLSAPIPLTPASPTPVATRHRVGRAGADTGTASGAATGQRERGMDQRVLEFKLGEDAVCGFVNEVLEAVIPPQLRGNERAYQA